MRADRLAHALAWSAATALVARHTVGTRQLASTLTWLKSPLPAPPTGASAPDAPCIHVIIPVLSEQQHVEQAIAWWRKLLDDVPELSLTLVSTAREERERTLLALAISRSARLSRARFPQLSSRDIETLCQLKEGNGGSLTVEMAVQMLACTPLTGEVIDRLLGATADEAGARVRHLTYPGRGRKAAQVNHAARWLPADGYVAVYDVDSRPSRDDLAAVTTLIATHDGWPPVVQQHALHLAAIPPLATGKRSLGDFFIRGSALLQSVWTLRREIPYARRYQRAALRPGSARRVWAGLAQPVGHGLFLRQDVVAELGGFPETTILDDVPLGVPLTLRSVPTLSVPRTCTVPAADTVHEVVAQGRRWFWSYLDYPALLRAHAQQGNWGHRHLLAVIAAYRGAAWLAAGPVTALGVVIAVAPRTGARLRVTAMAGVMLATVVPVVMTSAQRAARPTLATLSRESAELLAGYLIRSIGPWMTLADAARGRRPHSSDSTSPKAHRRQGESL